MVSQKIYLLYFVSKYFPKLRMERLFVGVIMTNHMILPEA